MTSFLVFDSSDIFQVHFCTCPGIKHVFYDERERVPWNHFKFRHGILLVWFICHWILHLCVLKPKKKELNLTFCLLHYSHHFWQFGGMQLCCFVRVCDSQLCFKKCAVSMEVSPLPEDLLARARLGEMMNLLLLEYLLGARGLCVSSS